MESSSASIRSVQDGAVLALTRHISNVDPDRFDYTLTTPVAIFSGSGSTYVSGSPALFFDRIAESWHVWQGDIKWATLENDFAMYASSDQRGHIQILVELRSLMQPAAWEFKYRLHLEAGLLESIARQFHQAFPANAHEPKT